jgi:hypothetical protein
MVSKEVLEILFLRLSEEKLLSDKEHKTYQIRTAISNPELYTY